MKRKTLKRKNKQKCCSIQWAWRVEKEEMKKKKKREKQTKEKAFKTKWRLLEARMECRGSSQYRKCPPSLTGTV